MKPILPALPGGILKEFDMHQARLGYPPIAQWVADENPIAATPRTTYVRPRLSEEEQARRRALDMDCSVGLKQAVVLLLEKKKKWTLEERGWIKWGINEVPDLPSDTHVQYRWMDHPAVYPLNAPSVKMRLMIWSDFVTAFRVVSPEVEYGSWIEWNGGKCPVYGNLVEVKLRNMNSLSRHADCLNWKQRGRTGDIVAYRVVKAVCDER